MTCLFGQPELEGAVAIMGLQKQADEAQPEEWSGMTWTIKVVATPVRSPATNIKSV